MPEFKDDAIVLSGETGTKLKSSILEDYYEFWWYITSGREKARYKYNTAIVEMNAATGEVYIEETGETILGSAGHALDLKINNPNARYLKIVCVEEHNGCYNKLKEVIKRRWPSVLIEKSEGPVENNDGNIYLINDTVDPAIEKIDRIELGNSIFFFDPLLNYDWNVIETVAKKRITSFLKTGTEFIIFLFTSDWLLGRKAFSPLPSTNIEDIWTSGERETVSKADSLFGNKVWRRKLLVDLSIEDREDMMVELYRNQLLNWFRYVLPLPFAPKENQVYHLFFCSNYELGINVTKKFYIERTGNEEYKPYNKKAYEIFRRKHPALFSGLRGNERPLEWKILWQIIRYQEGGVCDPMCDVLLKQTDAPYEVGPCLIWLKDAGYIQEIKDTVSKWTEYYPRYFIDWGIVNAVLGVDPPSKLLPIKPQSVKGETV